MKQCILLFIALFSCARIIAAPDTTKQKEIIIIFDGKGSSPVLLSEPGIEEKITGNNEIISLPSAEKKEKISEAPADTSHDQFIITHEYHKAEPDTSLNGKPGKRGAAKEEWYVIAGKVLLVIVMGFVALNAGMSVVGGLVLTVLGFILLIGGSTYAPFGALFMLLGIAGMALGTAIVIGIGKLFKLPFFDSILRRGRPARTRKDKKKEEKPQIFN